MGDRELGYTWTPGSGNGRALTSQEIEVATSTGFGGDVVASQTLAGNATAVTVSGLTNGVVHYARVRGVHEVGAGSWSTVASGVPTAPGVATDPNPIPAEGDVRYASPSGSGGGLTSGDPMSYTAGLDWIDDTAGAGGTLRLLAGTYSVNEYTFNNGRTVGTGKANYRVVRSDDLDNPAIIDCSQAGYGGFALSGGANRICFYGLEGDGNCSLTSLPASADGAQQFIRLGLSGGDATAKSCNHIWVKKCVMHHFWTGGVTTIGYDGSGTATASELFLIEDNTFYNNAHGAPWGGSGTSILYPQEGIVDGSVDDMFKPTIEGSQVTCGFIFRRNIGYRNYQMREDSAGTVYSDGNMVTTDYWNYDDWGGSNSDYNRGILVENNISFGNGRFYAATLTHPSAGAYVRFNTSVYDGITYRHGEFGTSDEAVHFGGWGGWNDVFRVHANVVVYDPAMSHPLGTGVHALSKDASSGGPAPTPLSSDWNLLVQNASAALGPVFASATNTVSTDPGLGAPPDYLTNNGEIAEVTLQSWASPGVGSSATQASCPYSPSDGVDAFWNARGSGSVGAVVPGALVAADQEWRFDGADGLTEARRFDVATPNDLDPTSLTLVPGGATDVTADGTWKANSDGTVSFTPNKWWGGETELERTATHTVQGTFNGGGSAAFTCTAIFDPFYWDGYGDYGTVPTATTTVAMSGLAAAVSAAAAGDVIVVTDSNQSGTVTLSGSGTSGNEIEIWAQNNKSAQCDQLTVTGSHLKIHGLRVNGGGPTGYGLLMTDSSTDNVEFHHCFFSNPNGAGTPASTTVGQIVRVGSAGTSYAANPSNILMDGCELYYGRKIESGTDYHGCVTFAWVDGLTVTNSKIWRLVKGRGVTLLDCQNVDWSRNWHEDNAVFAFRVWNSGDNISVNWNRSKDCGQAKENTVGNGHQPHFQFANVAGSAGTGAAGLEMIGNTCWESNPESDQSQNVAMKPVQATAHAGDVGGPYNGQSGTCSDTMSVYDTWGLVGDRMQILYNRLLNGGPGLEISGTTGVSETVVNQVGITVGDTGGAYIDVNDNIIHQCPRATVSVFGGYSIAARRNRGRMLGDWLDTDGGGKTPQGPDFFLASRTGAFALSMYKGASAQVQTPDHGSCEFEDNIICCYHEHTAYDAYPDVSSNPNRIPSILQPNAVTEQSIQIHVGAPTAMTEASTGTIYSPTDPDSGDLTGASGDWTSTIDAGMDEWLYLRW